MHEAFTQIATSHVSQLCMMKSGKSKRDPSQRLHVLQLFLCSTLLYELVQSLCLSSPQYITSPPLVVTHSFPQHKVIHPGNIMFAREEPALGIIKLARSRAVFGGLKKGIHGKMEETQTSLGWRLLQRCIFVLSVSLLQG